MRSISSRLRVLNSTTSSTRFRNSGRKCWRNSCMTAARAASLMSPASEMPSSKWWEPMFDVMMITVFLKSTVRPWASVTRPSSRICSSTLKTSW